MIPISEKRAWRAKGVSPLSPTQPTLPAQLQPSAVLIVDRSDESRDVLRTALEHRGLRVFEATDAADGLALARRHRPDLIVLDLEISPTSDDDSAPADLATLAQGEETPLVLLGSARRRTTAPAGQVVAKPYHYRPLILKIEQLLRRK